MLKFKRDLQITIKCIQSFVKVSWKCFRANYHYLQIHKTHQVQSPFIHCKLESFHKRFTISVESEAIQIIQSNVTSYEWYLKLKSLTTINLQLMNGILQIKQIVDILCIQFNLQLHSVIFSLKLKPIWSSEPLFEKVRMNFQRIWELVMKTCYCNLLQFMKFIHS